MLLKYVFYIGVIGGDKKLSVYSIVPKGRLEAAKGNFCGVVSGLTL